MKINMNKCNWKEYVALPFGIIAYCCVLICYLITNENVEVYRRG